ncbi:PAS domain-containing protein [Azospirillum sp.]|uniref:PAS domain-containing protein n=1 Tax=Azospirillum sp. TaxID=34012 RepID=UPI003D7224A2
MDIDLKQRLALAVLESPAEAVIYSDREGVIRLWNAGAERVFGFTAAEALGQSLDLIIPERQRKVHWDGYDAVMASGQSRYGSGDLLSVPALTKGGGRISVEFTIVPLKDEEGRMLGMGAILRDVTKRFEELKTLRRQAAQAAKQ